MIRVRLPVIALVSLLAVFPAAAVDSDVPGLENPFGADDTFRPIDLDADGVPDRPGQSDLSYFPPAQNSPQAAAPVPQAAPVTLGVTGPAGRSVEIALADADGRAVLSHRAKLDRTGRFRVDRVMPAGRYRLKARLMGPPHGAWRETSFIAGKNLAPTVNLSSL